MDKFQIEKLISATYAINNSTDANRSFAISAEVSVANGTVNSIQNGKVDGFGEPPKHYADFNDYGSLSSSIYDTYSDVRREDIFSAISNFCTTLRNAKNINL